MTPLFSWVLGACVGSFLNVCLVRWKSGGQILTPPSFCPRCKKSIQWFDNIPIVSFFLLGGKCRSCQKPISWQYPMVEMATAALFFANSWKFSKESFPFIVAGFLLVCFLILLVVSDIKWKLLPHLFNNLFILTGFFFIAFYFSSSSSGIFTAASEFIIIGSVMFGLIQFFPNGLGGGDIKLIAGLAVWMGFLKAVLILI
ncbi:MAG: prepilin peptidase, partial [Candidatus Paceibacterales bacterium]